MVTWGSCSPSGWRCSPGAFIAPPATKTESITLFQKSAEDDLAGRRRFDSRALGAAHPEDVRSNLKMARSDYRLLKRFKDDNHLSSFDADRILWAVMEVTDRVAERELAPEDLLDKISIPDVPENTEQWEDYDGWSAGAVQAASIDNIVGRLMLFIFTPFSPAIPAPS